MHIFHTTLVRNRESRLTQIARVVIAAIPLYLDIYARYIYEEKRKEKRIESWSIGQFNLAFDRFLGITLGNL